MITIEDLTYGYPESGPNVLEQLNLTIGQGESVCIMGANGCGKSTLAYILAGLIRGYSGSVMVDGREADERQVTGKVGILFQNPDNQMVATVVDKEIAFALENLAVDLGEMKQRVAEVARLFKIEHLLKRLTSELSGGEKQRVALASLMVRRPPLLILDEPDSFLDYEGRKILEKELTRIRYDDPRPTEIRITQYPSVAMTYPRLIVLHDGSVLADRPPQEVFSDKTLTARAGLQYHPSVTRGTAPETGLPYHHAQDDSTPHSIHLRNVSYHFSPSSPVLRDISFTIDRGETVGLVGATGVGKSTLGLLLCGIFQPAEGSMDLVDKNGRIIPVQDRSGRVVGLFQQPERQFFLTSCADEIAFGPKNSGRILTEDEIRSFFDLVGLDADLFAERDPFTLSMGEKRRLAFASVLSLSPSYVVFDEPTCGLDPASVGRFFRLVNELREMGVGQIIISHDGNVLKALANRVLWLSGASGITELGTDELFAGEGCAGIVSSPTSEQDRLECPG